MDNCLYYCEKNINYKLFDLTLMAPFCSKKNVFTCAAICYRCEFWQSKRRLKLRIILDE